ncbi:retrovirus-related pol polyprotein from transposon TNT 1-94 [Tanacetum coccineum]
MIGFDFTEKARVKLCNLLQRSLDIFAWTLADMTGIKRHIAEHRLNVREGCQPVRQKKRGQAVERNIAINDEVSKLVVAGIMREVHYHDWLSNPVMNGYPLPKIDWKVESLCGFPFKCFLDAYKGYHQIQMAEEDEEKTAFITNQEEAEAAFRQIKEHIAKLPMLTAPEEQEELIVYLAASKEVVSTVLMTESEARQIPIYFVSRALRGPEVNYTSMEKLVLALVHASKRLRRYFQAHPIIVITCPFHMGTVSDVMERYKGPVRARVLNDLSAEEKKRYKADIHATNILLQGIPKDIYSLINHYTDSKDIWENVKMILEGYELTKDDRESQLYDEFEHFRQIKGETIQGYYVRFTKLINDMRNIKMTMSRMQLNSKFVNNMLPEWSRFITEVKLNRGLKESNFDQLYAYLKQHEVHANENRMMMERFIQPTDDPLALVSNASNQKYPTQSSESPQSSNQPSIDVREEQCKRKCCSWECWRSEQSWNCNCKGIGHIARECPQPKRPRDSDYFKDKMLLMNAHENDVVLDEEQLLFLAGEHATNFDDDVDDLALNVDHVFEADQYDAFDSDVNEAPTTHTMFMVNLSSEDLIYNEAGPSYDSNTPFEVQDHDTFVDHMDEYHELHEMQSDVQHNSVVDFDADYTSDSNIIPYDQYVEDCWDLRFDDYKTTYAYMKINETRRT